MSLWSNPPHRISLLSSSSGSDGGGGTAISFTTAQSAVPCSINTTSANEQERFGQEQIVVSHVIGILASALTAVPQRGWKAVTDDRSQSFHIRGIRHGRQMGGVPAFVYLDCEELLG